jgi:hypothetical protein
MNNYRCTFRDYWENYTYQRIIKAKSKGDVWKKHTDEEKVEFLDRLIRVNKISDKMLEIYKRKAKVLLLKQEKKQATAEALAKLNLAINK